jgi:methionyl-tRNA formyltransferase
MQMKLKIVFFGSSKFVLPIIEVLKDNFELSLVITTEHGPNSPIISYCKKHKLHCYIVLEYRKQKNDIIKIIQAIKVPLGILASFGAIIPSEILQIFPKGILNIHPSLLPKYRGPTPVQTAILKGDKTTGVTIIKLDEQVDHGPILFQKKEAILENDTSESLYDRLFRLGSSSIVRTIQLYSKGKITPRKQDHSKATFTRFLTRQDGFVDLQVPPAPEVLNRMIRAYYPWPGVCTKLKIKNEKLKIIKFLPDKKIQVEGRKPISYKDFLNGYPEAPRNLEFIIQN